MENKPKILLVDDRIENLIALETVLADMDVELVRTTNGNDALKQTLYNDFALALIDIQMPDMDGFELAGLLREEEKTATMPFIFISGVFTDNPNIFKGYDKGAFSFVTKPFHPDTLLSKVKLFVDNYQHENKLIQLNEDLKNKNVELISLNKELESFTYSVSHDLRAPLRAISGYSKILLNEHCQEVSPEIKRLLNNINANARKMGELIDTLLSFSKLGKQGIKKDHVNMNSLLKSVVEEIKSSDEGKKVTWSIGEIQPCYGDFHLLRQVLINLISNAVKYSSKLDSPIIEIKSECTKIDCVYSIRDNGIGLDMKYANKLFQVFQRLHSPSEYEGTGIGLAIVHKIVTRHGGWVKAESKLNEGATFYFGIPVEGNRQI